VHAIGDLQERRQALQPVGQLGRNQVQVHASALLEISKLRDLQAIQHHLPADAPGSQRGRFPVVLLQLDVVLAQIDPDRLQAFQIQIDHVIRRGLEDYLQLLVLVQPVGIFAVTAIGGPAAGLYIGHAVRIRPKHAQESLRRHGAGADLAIVGLLNHAILRGPITFQLENDLLKRIHVHEASRTGAVISLRSVVSSMRWIKNRRRSAAVSFDHVPDISATGLLNICAAMALDSTLISQLSWMRQPLQNRPALERLNQARPGPSGSSSQAPHPTQTSSAGSTPASRTTHRLKYVTARHRFCALCRRCSSTASSRRKNRSLTSAGGRNCSETSATKSSATLTAKSP